MKDELTAPLLSGGSHRQLLSPNSPCPTTVKSGGGDEIALATVPIPSPPVAFEHAATKTMSMPNGNFDFMAHLPNVDDVDLEGHWTSTFPSWEATTCKQQKASAPLGPAAL